MNWYDELTDEQIQEMKGNKEVFCLMEPWKQEAFDVIRCETSDLVFLDPSDKWLLCPADGLPCIRHTVYRLRSDWTRPVGKKGYEEVVVDVVVPHGIALCGDCHNTVGEECFHFKGKLYHQAVYAYELPFYGNSYKWTKNHIMFSNGKSLKDAPTEEWIVPVHPIQVRGVRWE